MSEWWTYTLSDFLLFSPRTYDRLLEIYNAAIWPAQVLALILGAAVAVRVRRASGRAARAVAGIFAACWIWVAIAFHARRYATINWAAVYFAWAFGLEAALLAWIGLVRARLRFESTAGVAPMAGLAIFLYALVLEPAAGVLAGRPWKQAQVFGVFPDPTAIATLGLLLLAEGPGRGLLMIVPAIWCAITGLTLLAMKTGDFWVAPVAAAVAVGLAIGQARAGRRPASR